MQKPMRPDVRVVITHIHETLVLHSLQIAESRLLVTSLAQSCVVVADAMAAPSLSLVTFQPSATAGITYVSTVA